MQDDSNDAANPGRMCLRCLGSLEADTEPQVRKPAKRPPQPDIVRAERHIPITRNNPYHPPSNAPKGFEETSFAQYLAHISADPEDVHRQGVSSAFSQYSKETAPVVERKRKVCPVHSYGVLARFLPNFDRGSSKQKAGGGKAITNGKKSKKTRLRKFFRKCRVRMGKKQQKSSVEKKEDSVIDGLEKGHVT